MAEEMIYDANGNATGYTADPVSVATTEPSSFSLGGIFDSARDLLANATGIDRVDIGRQLISGMTPERAIDFMATQMITADSTDEHKAAINDLVTTVKSDPEFARNFYSALVNDHTMLPGLMARGSDGSSVDALKVLNEKLSDPNNREVIGRTLDVIARSNNDTFNYAYFEKMEELNASQNYAGLRDHLAQAGITDPRLVFASGDLGGMWDMFMENPDQIGAMLANYIPNGDALPADFKDVLGKMGMSGEDFSNFFKGLAVIMPNIFSTLLGPEFLGHYADNIIAPIGAWVAEKGADAANIDITGKRDEEIAAQRDVAGTGEHIDPATQGIDVSQRSLSEIQAASTAVPAYTADQNRYDQQVASWTAPIDRSVAATPSGP